MTSRWWRRRRRCLYDDLWGWCSYVFQKFDYIFRTSSLVVRVLITIPAWIILFALLIAAGVFIPLFIYPPFTAIATTVAILYFHGRAIVLDPPENPERPEIRRGGSEKLATESYDQSMYDHDIHEYLEDYDREK